MFVHEKLARAVAEKAGAVLELFNIKAGMPDGLCPMEADRSTDLAAAIAAYEEATKDA